MGGRCPHPVAAVASFTCLTLLWSRLRSRTHFEESEVSSIGFCFSESYLPCGARARASNRGALWSSLRNYSRRRHFREDTSAQAAFLAGSSAILVAARVFVLAVRRQRLHARAKRTEHTPEAWDCFTRIYCINLDKRPERWEFMQRQFEELQMPAVRWPAVDGQTLDVQALVESGELSSEALPRLLMPDREKIFGMDLTPGALGCAMSHYHIWIDIMWRRGRGESTKHERDDIYLVVEDDCEFLHGFCEDTFRGRLAELPDDWQLAFLGGVDALGFQALLQVAPGVRRVYNGSRETTAYIMNIEGVRAALKVCFPLKWQLDTQLTLVGRPVEWNPQLTYTVEPMSYLFWPPLVEQNKEDFPTDVQKDEHPRYLNGKGVPPDVWASPEEALTQLRDTDLDALERRYSLVGNWDDWRGFYDLSRRGEDEVVFTAELAVPPGRIAEFQIVRDRDWNQRLYPTPEGEILLGHGSVAHGCNWRLQVPAAQDLGSLVLHVMWDPTGYRFLECSFGESNATALSRSYALVGNWNGWTKFNQFVRDEPGSTTYTAVVDLPAGQDAEFQVVCNRNWRKIMFPSPNDRSILGPIEDAHGKNWRIEAPPKSTTMYVCWNPTGKRSLKCALGEPPIDMEYYDSAD